MSHQVYKGPESDVEQPLAILRQELEIIRSDGDKTLSSLAACPKAKKADNPNILLCRTIQP